MAKEKIIPLKDDEKAFEDHFCMQLQLQGKYNERKHSEIKKRIDKDVCLYFDDLEEYLKSTQLEKLTKFKDEFQQSWKEEIKTALKQALAEGPLFKILQNGLSVGNYEFEIVSKKPERESNIDALERYKKNRFTAVRQWSFGAEGEAQDKSLDIVLLVNGLAIVTIELKNEGTSGNYNEAIKQYLGRPLELSIFRNPFLHIVSDNETAKMAAAFGRPPSERDFRHFNKNLKNIPVSTDPYGVYYLYHEILLPDSLLNFMENYLYVVKKNSWMFPRYHQQRATRKVVSSIKNKVAKTGELNLNYLIQHSTGSGKSSTIVWMVQNLRNAFNGIDPIFDSIIVLTDRINLDDQISKDFRQAIETDGVAEYAEKTQDLKKALEEDKKVIVSTIHKFSHLKDLADQTNKKICVLIDEAHRSQEGKLHSGMTATFKTDENGVELAPPDEGEEFIKDASRKKYPNMAFIALTATPSQKTIEHFGELKTDDKGAPILDEKGKKQWTAFDIYSMDQAIKEGYIMDVAKNIYSYDTLYELNKEVDTKKEYLPMPVIKAIRQKAFQDTKIIKDKCDRMLTIFKNKSAHKIENKAKAMVVTSSRIAACKYKLLMDEEIKRRGLKYKTLIAFSGGVEVDALEFTDDELSRLNILSLKGTNFSEDGMNKAHNPKGIKTEDIFNQKDDIRFLIVANKFQTGFSESLLHTMFVDKPLRDKNAVQTLSRLNRMHKGKDDTLVIDFTGSYEQIMKAYMKYQDDVKTHTVSDPSQLKALKIELLKFKIFTEEDVTLIADLINAGNEKSRGIILGHIRVMKSKLTDELSRDKRDAFKTLVVRYINLYKYISALYDFRDKSLTDLQQFLIWLNHKIANSSNSDLENELKDVKVVNHSIPEIDIDKIEIKKTTNTSSKSASITSVKKTKTVKEIIDQINEMFKAKIGDEGITVIGEYLEDVKLDKSLIKIIKSNVNKDIDRVYDEIMKGELEKKLRRSVAINAPEKMEDIMLPDICSFVSRQAYNLLLEEAA